MPGISDYFKKAQPAWETHPMVRHWRAMQKDPTVSGLKMELYRPREGLTFRPADIYVHVERKNGPPAPPHLSPWEDVLNEGLVHLKVRATSMENEAQRFSLMLQSAFGPIDSRFGATFFNAVLIDRIRTGPFAGHLPVAQVLETIREYAPNREQAWDDCVSMIDNAIAGRANELVDELGYTQPEAETILANALGQYLDERFNVTNRKLLGW
ncbi:hypothetical protein [Stigmatella aurantiaca]|uniref:Uncharacterized protein n=1 Tax=Stigmatella aurantiaca (strain DW4/3-1) TaxID=378806 RepID=Q08RZ4_STIAD|nr:hypothetical protein [Stigmatella aurantiaca]ADO68376.1 uncharacterized protein STAUR_0572 [Stigmatella aurantiaca DW4/3-1]EAU63253.1 hypothetical protein STIAU_1632 [Stigmatella aurantiaca DW4/3-1]